MSFLSNGARPNARVYRLTADGVAGSVAWADFLFITFKFPSDMIHESMYLDVLDDFMVGVDFGEISEDLDDLYPGKWNFENWNGPGGIHCKFFTHLKAISEDDSIWINKRLLAEVTDRILSKADESGEWPLELIWSIVEEVFPHKVFSKLKDKYTKEGMTAMAVSETNFTRKRGRETETGGPPQKRPATMDAYVSVAFNEYDRDTK